MKTIREALKEIYETRSYYDSEEWVDLILNILVERLPKEKQTYEVDLSDGNREVLTNRNLGEAVGYNQALKDVKEMLSNLDGSSDEK